jgi:molybdate transport system substrate-binding protein
MPDSSAASKFRIAACVAVLLFAAQPGGAEETRAPAQSATVAAAASLTDVFKTLGAAFQKTRANTTVTFNFAASSTLAEQITHGAPADVFASADEASMKKLAEAGALAAPARIFATNRLALVVQPGNPERIASLADLTRPGLTLAMAAPAVPAGRYAAEAFAKAHLKVPPGSQELDVRAALNRVVLGEADAAVVYFSDAHAAGKRVHMVPIPDAQNITATYPIAVLKDAADPKLATAFVDYVLSSAGRATLFEFGFLPP